MIAHRSLWQSKRKRGGAGLVAAVVDFGEGRGVRHAGHGVGAAGLAAARLGALVGLDGRGELDGEAAVLVDDVDDDGRLGLDAARGWASSACSADAGTSFSATTTAPSGAGSATALESTDATAGSPSPSRPWCDKNTIRAGVQKYFPEKTDDVVDG